MRFEFTLLRTSETDFYLLGNLPDHVGPCFAINKYAGAEVVRLNGTGIGVNLKILDFDAWSNKIAQHVTGDHPHYALEIPEPQPEINAIESATN